MLSIVLVKNYSVYSSSQASSHNECTSFVSSHNLCKYATASDGNALIPHEPAPGITQLANSKQSCIQNMGYTNPAPFLVGPHPRFSSRQS